MTQREKMEIRLRIIEKQIAEYPYWGGALTALDEERRGLKRAIEQATSPATSHRGD